ncbi:MAG: hypothetical protein ABDH19_07815 [Thermodesulfovibrio sp.]
MKKTVFFVIFIFVLSSNSYAFDKKGFSPTAPFSVISTFSAESPRQNQVAIDFSFEVASDPDIKRTNLNISYGLTNNVEILGNFPYNLSYNNSLNSNGAEDINFGFKHRVINETTYLPAFAYMLYVSGPLGNDEFTTEGGFGGAFIVTKKVGPVKAHGNLIYFKPSKEGLKEIWNLNIGSELRVSYNSIILLEIIGRKAIDKNKIDLIEWRLGYRVRVTDFSYTNVSTGFDIKNNSPDFRFMFGISLVLPGEKPYFKGIVKDTD